jgi:hypothetical protein
MKRAILQINQFHLGRLLQLPAGVEVVDARMDPERVGLLLLKVEGAGYELDHGCVIPKFNGTVTKTGDREVIDWGFPKEDHE